MPYICIMKRPLIIHDPVHKTIILNELEQMLINTWQVQRLRNIQQLGLADVAYPGANHTRFEHSLGTMHTASIMAEALGLEGEDIWKLRVAGLLHDVGHSAFSHAVETVLDRNPHLQPQVDGRRFIKHELFTKDIISKSFPADASISKYVEQQFGADAYTFFDEIARMATGDFRSMERPYLAQIISGDIDADRIDFLLRDSYHTGVSLGLIDVDQIVQALNIKDDQLVLGDPEGSTYTEDMVLTAAESILIARAHHYMAIIHNPRTQASRSMFLYALEDSLLGFREMNGDEAAREKVVEFFTIYNDNDLLGFINENGSTSAQELVRQIRNGEVYSTVSRSNHKTLSPLTKIRLSTIARHGVARKMFESGLAKELGNFLVDLSVATGIPKSMRVVTASGESFFYDESPLANGLVRSISRQISLSVFAHPDALSGLDTDILMTRVCSVVDELSPKLLRFIRGEQYLSIEGLLLLLYSIHVIFEKKEDGFIFIPRLHNITWIYRTVEAFGKIEILKNLFDYEFHTRYGFPYSDRLFEDVQILVAMGMVDEDLRYFEKDRRLKQRYEYVLTFDGFEYAGSLVDAYGREFEAINEYVVMNKHSVVRDIVRIPQKRYCRKTKKGARL